MKRRSYRFNWWKRKRKFCNKKTRLSKRSKRQL